MNNKTKYQTILSVALKKDTGEKVKLESTNEKRTVSNLLRLIIEKHYDQKEALLNEGNN